MMFAGLLHKSAAYMAQLISRAVLPRFKPPVLAPGGEAIAQLLNDDYAKANANGFYSALEVINQKSVKASNGHSLSSVEIAANLSALGDRLKESLRTKDADGLAADLVKELCIGVLHMKDLDNQRRTVAAWSAILAPSVVQREANDVAITLQSIVDSGVDWLTYGYTSASRQCYAKRATKFISSHPARMYQLIADTAHSHGLDHDMLMLTLIKPIVVGIGYHLGAARAASEYVPQLNESVV